MLVERGYIEEDGRDIRRMREEMAGLDMPKPEFREDSFSFLITFCAFAPREEIVPTPDRFLSGASTK